MSENTDKNKKPAIRFKDFQDSWEQRKLTDFVEFFSGLTYTPNDVQKNGTLVLRSSNVSNGEIVNADNVYVRHEVVNTENVKEGDIIVVVRNGSRSLIGKHAQIKRFMANTVIGAFMTGIRSECPSFTNALLNTPHFDEEVAINMGATINQITGYMFSKMEFKIPSLIEQRKIGKYFEHLDNLITLHQRKLEKLKNVKKSMLEKMFPKNGSNVPEIRFAGFTAPWEQRKFSELVETRRGLTYKPTDIREKGVRVLRSSNIDEDRFVEKDDDVFVDENAINIGFAKEKDILITAANGSSRLVGKHAIVSNIPYKSTVHGGFMLLGTSEEPYFANASMSSSWYKRFIDLYVSGGNGAIGNLNKSDLDEQVILVPQKKEQQAIGHFFANLDNLITLHQHKLEKLQNIKKSMLEKLLV
ncbi:MAG: restriction endonuclease subunit S [Acutalibacteraceae bacterium]